MEVNFKSLNINVLVKEMNAMSRGIITPSNQYWCARRADKMNKQNSEF
jgi:hypothetical protein